MLVNVTKIVYDTDGEDIEDLLPSELTIDIPDNENNIQLYIENHISNQVGFLTESFIINK